MNMPLSASVSRPARHRIVGADILPCHQPQEDPTWKFSRGSIARLEGWLVRLRTDEGAVGWGYIEVIPVVSTTAAGAHAAFEALAPLLIGADPFDIGALLGEMDRHLAGHVQVKAAFDAALHELMAAILGEPLYRLFGGRVQAVVPVTRILPLKPPAVMAAEAQRLAGRGYRFLKLKLDGRADVDVERVGRVRDAVGAGVRLSVDPNQAYGVKGAIAMLRRLTPYGVDLVEQPVPAEDRVGLKQVRDAVDIPVEADESITSLRALLDLIADRALDSANLKVADLGGLHRTRTAAALCEAAGIDYRIGATFGPRLVAAQGLHLAASFVRQFHAHELAEFEHLLDDPFGGLEVNEDGHLTVPDGPGSGVYLLSTNC